MADELEKLFGPVQPVREQKRTVELRERELPFTRSQPLGVLKGRNGVSVTYDKNTQVAIRDSKGVVKVFAKNERSIGTVNNRLYDAYASKNYATPKGRVKKQKPFVASVTPFEPKACSAFYPFVNHKKEEGN